METLDKLIKKYPNDMDLGLAVRKMRAGDNAIELLKEVLALHGWGGYGYTNGLVERGVLYLQSEDGRVRRYRHSCDSETMQRVDSKIIEFLKSFQSELDEDKKN